MQPAPGSLWYIGFKSHEHFETTLPYFSSSIYCNDIRTAWYLIGEAPTHATVVDIPQEWKHEPMEFARLKNRTHPITTRASRSSEISSYKGHKWFGLHCVVGLTNAKCSHGKFQRQAFPLTTESIHGLHDSYYIFLCYYWSLNTKLKVTRNSIWHQHCPCLRYCDNDLLILTDVVGKDCV